MLSAKVLDSVSGSNPEAKAPRGFPGELRGLKKIEKCYPRGSVLFVEGQLARGIYILHEGRVKVSIASAEGKKLVMRIAEHGDLLGMNATLTGKPYAATAETLDRCRLEFIPREALFTLLAQDHRGYAGVAQALSRKLSSIVEHTRLLFLSQCASEKVARLLVRWCDEHGKITANGIQVGSGLTHEDIAQMICSSRETVTRVLSEFRRKRIVSLVDNTIFVLNRKALEDEARC